MEPWVGESDAAWGAAAPEREAARQRAAANQAIQAVFQPEDPNLYYSYAEVSLLRKKAKQLAELSGDGDLAEEIKGAAEILMGAIIPESIPAALLEFFVEGIAKQWLGETSEDLDECADDLRKGRPMHERRYCHLKYDTIKIAKITVVDFFSESETLYCVAYTGPLKRKKGHCKFVPGGSIFTPPIA
jgi:hypothetical protein